MTTHEMNLRFRMEWAESNMVKAQESGDYDRAMRFTDILWEIMGEQMYLLGWGND